jgi:hypothetical protein
VARQRADDQPAARDGLLEGGQLLVALEQLGRLAVPVTRVGARADLDRLETELLHVVERFLEGLVAEQYGEHAKLHEPVSLCVSS